MHARLMTLEDLVPVARALRNASEQRRLTQGRLRDYVRALVEAYGYRPDYRGASSPWSVPYVPMPFAGEMVSYFQAQAKYWLGRSVPDGAKQPNLIRNWTKRAADIVGQVKAGVVEAPNVDSYEDAPASVAAKAPAMFKPERASGQPHAKVLTAEQTWQLLNALVRLAMHYDVLSGQPTKLDIFAAEVVDQAERMGAGAVDAIEGAAELPGKAAKAGGNLLKWGAIALAGLGALYVVTR